MKITVLWVQCTGTVGRRSIQNVTICLQHCMPSHSRRQYPHSHMCERSFIPFHCAECDNSLSFSGASSIPLCYIPSPSTLFHQLVFHPPSLHLAIYFLVYFSTSFPNSYIIPFLGILFYSILCTRSNQRRYSNYSVLISKKGIIIRSVTSVCLSLSLCPYGKTSAPTGQIIMKFCI